MYAMLLAWLRKKLPSIAVLAAPFLWVTLELIRTYLFSGLPWALLGYSQYLWLPAIQIADLTGIYGVSFVIVLVNGASSEIILWILRRLNPDPYGQPFESFPWVPPTAAALAMTTMLLYGQWSLLHAPLALTFPPEGEEQGKNSASFPSGKEPTAHSASPAREEQGKSLVVPAIERQKESRSISIGLVQPNIDQAQKWDRAYVRETLDRYRRLTAQVTDHADLIIWPEASTPFLFEQEREYRAEVAAMLQPHTAPLLLGSPALRYYPSGRPYLLNSAYLFSSEGEILGRYDKRHLVPFGEYVPLRSVLFFLDKLVEGIGDFEAGTVPAILALPAPSQNSSGMTKEQSAKFGVVICFEVIFPDLVREFARDGAEFMVTITNDAWFGDSAAPFQHFGMVVFRAVENRLAFARAANTGISGFIDPYGRILAATPLFTEQAVTGRIPARNTPTFYSHYGDIFAYGCVIMAEIFLLVASLRRATRKRIRGYTP
ncbi:MAG: apolipoprotein N-acyltransferase [Nitrospiraceae bacterium]